jgi:hypothetical protein
MLEKVEELSYEVTASGDINVKKVIVIKEDGVVISRSQPHRCVVEAGDDEGIQNALGDDRLNEIQVIKESVFTRPEAVALKAKREAQTLEGA